MADVQNESPPLTDEAQGYAGEIVENFENDLKAIAATVARNGEAETIIVPHIKHAHQTLKRAGLGMPRDVPFYRRPDVWIGLGTFLVGLGPTLSSFSKDILEAPDASGKSVPASQQPVDMWIWMIVIPCVIACIGMFLAGCGWRHSGSDSV